MKNLLEDAIASLFDELRAEDPAICGCEHCRSDVMALALNVARPRYSGGTDVGRALISVDLQRNQTRAALAVIVLESIRRVAVNPRHGGRP